MPYDDPDPTDPMTLHGVAVETDDESATLEMAACFVEEYARLGFDADRMMHLFRTRGYAGPYLAGQKLGDEAIRALIEDELRRRGGRGRGSNVFERTGASIRLRVLE